MKSGLIGIGLRVLLVFRRRKKKKRKPDNSGSKIAPTVPSELIVNTRKLAGRFPLKLIPLLAGLGQPQWPGCRLLGRERQVLVVTSLTDLSFPPPGSATKPPTAVTAATSCAVGAAITPTRTAWWSGVTASTTGAATSPAAGVNAPWSATSASEAARALPLCRGAVPPRGPTEGPGDPVDFPADPRCQAWEEACAVTPFGSHREQEAWSPWEGRGIKGNR